MIKKINVKMDWNLWKLILFLFLFLFSFFGNWFLSFGGSSPKPKLVLLLLLLLLVWRVGFDEEIDKEKKIRGKKEAAKETSIDISIAAVIKGSMMVVVIDVHAVIACNNVNDELDDLKGG